MKIVCSKSNLVKGVNIVSKAVPSKTTMPILECILIDANMDVIKLTSNDMELGIQSRNRRRNYQTRYDCHRCKNIFRNRKKTTG